MKQVKVKRDYSIRGAITRLKKITVLEMKDLPLPELERLADFCKTFSVPLKEEMVRRSTENI